MRRTPSKWLNRKLLSQAKFFLYILSRQKRIHSGRHSPYINQADSLIFQTDLEKKNNLSEIFEIIYYEKCSGIEAKRREISACVRNKKIEFLFRSILMVLKKNRGGACYICLYVYRNYICSKGLHYNYKSKYD